MIEHKNKIRAAILPLDFKTLMLTSGGLGFLRPAPGTWGTTPPVIIIALLMWQGFGNSVLLAVTLGILLLASAACILFGVYAEARFGLKDAAEVVADETAGVCLPVLVAVLGHDELRVRLILLVAAFVLFRLFDIAKPWPMHRLEQLSYGWGVLLDDLMAGVYSAVFLMVIAGLWHGAY